MNSLVTITKKNYQNYLDGIIEIERSSFPTPWSTNSFIQEIKNSVSHLWAVILKSNLSAYICFWMFASEIQLINIAVHTEWRGKGFGHNLLMQMIEAGISKGIQQVWLEVRLSNMPAKMLYEKLGFLEVGRRRKYYSDTNEDAIIMALSLSNDKQYRFASN